MDPDQQVRRRDALTFSGAARNDLLSRLSRTSEPLASAPQAHSRVKIRNPFRPASHRAGLGLAKPSKLRYIAFSHVEADECGALTDFLKAAPQAQPVCNQVAAIVSVKDMVDVEPIGMEDGQALELGHHKLRWQSTPHLPHSWECGYLFDKTTRNLFCGDLFTQPGTGDEPLTGGDILGPSEAFRHQMDYFSHKRRVVDRDVAISTRQQRAPAGALPGDIGLPEETAGVVRKSAPSPRPPILRRSRTSHVPRWRAACRAARRCASGCSLAPACHRVGTRWRPRLAAPVRPASLRRNRPAARSPESPRAHTRWRERVRRESRPHRLYLVQDIIL